MTLTKTQKCTSCDHTGWLRLPDGRLVPCLGCHSVDEVTDYVATARCPHCGEADAPLGDDYCCQWAQDDDRLEASCPFSEFTADEVESTAALAAWSAHVSPLE